MLCRGNQISLPIPLEVSFKVWEHISALINNIHPVFLKDKISKCCLGTAGSACCHASLASLSLPLPVGTMWILKIIGGGLSNIFRVGQFLHMEVRWPVLRCCEYGEPGNKSLRLSQPPAQDPGFTNPSKL